VAGATLFLRYQILVLTFQYSTSLDSRDWLVQPSSTSVMPYVLL
jgi:hypothetical protein